MDEEVNVHYLNGWGKPVTVTYTKDALGYQYVNVSRELFEQLIQNLGYHRGE